LKAWHSPGSEKRTFWIWKEAIGRTSEQYLGVELLSQVADWMEVLGERKKQIGNSHCDGKWRREKVTSLGHWTR
jgi:hypothetical protein